MDFYNAILNGKEYNEFITYSLKTSDKFSFFIPHFNVLSPSEKEFRDAIKERVDSDYVINAKKEAELNEEIQRYLSKMQEKISIIENEIINIVRDYTYLGYEYGHLCESYWISTSGKNVKEFLLSETGIFSWRYPYAPEDIAFFRGDTIWCRTVAHEKLLSFSWISKQEIDYIRKQWIKT